MQRVLRLKSYQTAWTWLHKLRRAMVRPGWDRLTGWVEVDETYLGGLEESVAGRQHGDKVFYKSNLPAYPGTIRERNLADLSTSAMLNEATDSAK